MNCLLNEGAIINTGGQTLELYLSVFRVVDKDKCKDLSEPK